MTGDFPPGTVVGTGHWHVQSMFLIRKGRGVEVWQIDMEQKRAGVRWTAITDDENGDEVWQLGIGFREYDVTGQDEPYLRDGEDGWEVTTITLPKPKRTWLDRLRKRHPFWFTLSDVDKYTIYVTRVRA